MNDLFAPFLNSQPFVVLDGAMATELEGMGARLDDPLWSAKVLIESPELIRQVHIRYLEAGADIITTASYQATYAGFARRGLDRETSDRLFRKSVRLAEMARSAFWRVPTNRLGRVRPLIAASIGPYGAYLADGSEYHGNYDLSLEALKNWHRPQVEVLSELEGTDFLLFETIPSFLEAKGIIQLMKAYPDMPYLISFSCKDGRLLSHGERLSEVVRELSRVNVLMGIGLNCTAPGFIEPLLRSVRDQLAKPLMVYPNSGEIWDGQERCWRMPEHPLSIPDLVASWYQNGARIIGGCCRTTPAQTAAIRNVMLELR